MTLQKRRSARRFASLALAAVTVVAAASAQTPPQAPPQPPRFGTSASGVILDVVVRDKKGPVTDLTADDFEILEEGTPQKVLTFERHFPAVQPAVGAPSQAGAIARPAVGGGDPGAPVIALAFDRLSPEGRALARKAAMQFLKAGSPRSSSACSSSTRR
jgi:hypothetical protein